MNTDATGNRSRGWTENIEMGPKWKTSEYRVSSEKTVLPHISSACVFLPIRRSEQRHPRKASDKGSR